MRFLVTTASKFPAPPEQVAVAPLALGGEDGRYAEQLQEYGSFVGPAASCRHGGASARRRSRQRAG
jgi:hypothetical protein